MRLYLDRLFVPLGKVNDELLVGVVERSGFADIGYLEKKYQSRIRVKSIQKTTFTKLIQRSFSEHLLDLSTEHLDRKLPAFSAKKTLSESQKKAFLLSAFFGAALIWYDVFFEFVVVIISCFAAINCVYKAILFFTRCNIEEPAQEGALKRYPIYSVLLPLYKESLYTLKGLIDSISELDYPRSRLEVKIIVEQFDRQTIAGLKKINLPHYFQIICVKSGHPKTKPKACNYALRFVKGEYLVIYDAEDRPDKDQLKKALMHFLGANNKVVCLQAPITFYNKGCNLLTKLMCVEYKIWFNYFLKSLQKHNLPIPLGGNSNHFKVKELKKIGGWDSYNVTEDADLGMRIFKRGYRVEMLDSTTHEEGPEKVLQFLKQRSRWIKGHIQTYFVHTRSISHFLSRGSYYAFFGFLNFLILPTIAFLSPFVFLLSFVFLSVDSLLAQKVINALLFGNLAGWIALSCVMFFVASRSVFSDLHDRLFVSFCSPFYHLLHSASALIAAVEILYRPHYWHKTPHHSRVNKKI